MASVFVYGTLQAEEVLLNLIQRVPQKRPALIRGYRRYAIRGQNFPGTVHATDSDTVEGTLLEGLSPAELRSFDAFEGEEYVQEQVLAEHAEGGGSARALLYIWLERELLYGSWDYQKWRAEHLTDYAVMVSEFAAELDHGEEPEPLESPT